MTLEFKLDDRVQLTPTAVSLYGGVSGWVPKSQGGGKPGIVIEADENRPHDPRAAARPYLVRWGNGAVNSYRVEDLEREVRPAAELNPTEAPTPGSNIISFIRPVHS